MTIDVTLPGNLSGFAAGIAAPLEFGIGSIKKAIGDLTPEQLVQVPAGLKNSIAGLIIHVAATEIKFSNLIKGERASEEIQAEYLFNLPQNPIPTPEGETAASLTAKMEKARATLLETLATLSDADVTREITLPNGRVLTVRYLLTILAGHQAQHWGHIQYIKQLIAQ